MRDLHSLHPHTIKEIKAREIFDSRFSPTIEVILITSGDIQVTASVPSGASKGLYEAVELRDDDLKRFAGKGVLKALKGLNEKFAPRLLGLSIFDQTDIDSLLCSIGGEEKKNYGSNATLGLSLAVAKAAAVAKKMPLWEYLASYFSTIAAIPRPMINCINGGMHNDGSSAFQEFMITLDIPFSLEGYLSSAYCFWQQIKKELLKKGLNSATGDEGGFSAPLGKEEEIFNFLDYCKNSSAVNGISYAIDVASSTFYKNGMYEPYQGVKYQSSDWANYLINLAKKYKIFSIEDGMAEDDWIGWSYFKKNNLYTELFVGDDLIATNRDRLQRAVESNAANALIVKPNQRGTITETFDVAKAAVKFGLVTVASHRSGETCDTSIVDIAVAIGASYIKIGGLSRSERVEKYNRLLAIIGEQKD